MNREHKFNGIRGLDKIKVHKKVRVFKKDTKAKEVSAVVNDTLLLSDNMVEVVFEKRD